MIVNTSPSQLNPKKWFKDNQMESSNQEQRTKRKPFTIGQKWINVCQKGIHGSIVLMLKECRN